MSPKEIIIEKEISPGKAISLQALSIHSIFIDLFEMKCIFLLFFSHDVWCQFQISFFFFMLHIFFTPLSKSSLFLFGKICFIECDDLIMVFKMLKFCLHSFNNEKFTVLLFIFGHYLGITHLALSFSQICTTKYTVKRPGLG